MENVGIIDEIVNDPVIQKENLKKSIQGVNLKRNVISEDIYIKDFPMVNFFL